MKVKRNVVVYFLIVVTLLAIPLWFLSYPETTFRHNLRPWYIYGSQLSGILGFVLYSFSLILSTRLEWIEDLFGGLDKVYQTHHTIGKIAFFLILIHPIILAARWIPRDILMAFQYLLPTHRRPAINLGSWAFLLFLLLILFTLVIKIPYDKWKWTHKLTGVVFFFSVLHIFLLDELIATNPPLAIYLGIFSVLGVIALLYKSVFYHWLADKKPYEVEKIDKLNDMVMKITLEPQGGQLSFTPGQFCFVSYRDPEISIEAHPFTICSQPIDKNITIIVKALGNYTKHLYRTLTVGTQAFIEGPYGRFNYQKHDQPQVWIAGGVGIAPFISWVESLNETEIPDDFDTDLYYCVNSLDEATHIEQFRMLENRLPGFTFHLSCTDRDGFLSAKEIDNIKKREIFICGPKEMRISLLKEFRELHIPDEVIHYEDFDFI